jgi:hypothetical protein
VLGYNGSVNKRNLKTKETKDMNLWNEETPIADLDINITIPAWIEQDISPYDIAAICQGGCASGAYMPAVTYFEAKATMAKHGDEVLQYIEDALGELPQPPADSSWSGIAVFYLSVAVELWAGGGWLEDISNAA